jgi:hypothetical protein
MRRTVNSKISKGSAGSPLDLCVMVAEEVEDGVESVPADLADFFLGDLSKGESGTPLEINVFRK